MMADTVKKETKKRNPSAQYKAVCIILLVGLAIFLTSNLWLPSAQKVIHTDIGKSENTSPNVSITLVDWQYNPQTLYMEAAFAVHASSAFYSPGFRVAAISINHQNVPLEASVAYCKEQSLIVQIKNLPKDWDILALWIADDVDTKMLNTSASDETQTTQVFAAGNGVRFNCDARKVKQNLSLAPKTEKDYRVQAVQNEIVLYNQKISEYERQIVQNSERTNTLNGEIKSIQAEQKYQTDSEIRDSNSAIQQKQKEIESLKGKDAETQKQILDCKEKIQKLNEKMEAIRRE